MRLRITNRLKGLGSFVSAGIWWLCEWAGDKLFGDAAFGWARAMLSPFASYPWADAAWTYGIPALLCGIGFYFFWRGDGARNRFEKIAPSKELRVPDGRTKTPLNESPAVSESIDPRAASASRLIAEINEINGGGYIPGQPEDVPLIIVMTIKNVGNYPTIVDNYEIEVLAGGKHYRAEIQHMPMPISVGGRNDSGIVERTFFPNDAIYVKTANSIPIGSMVRGFIYANMKLFDRSRFTDMDITVKFRDIFGTEYSVSETPRGKEEGTSFHPQMKNDVEFSNGRGSASRQD